MLKLIKMRPITRVMRPPRPLSIYPYQGGGGGPPSLYIYIHTWVCIRFSPRIKKNYHLIGKIDPPKGVKMGGVLPPRGGVGGSFYPPNGGSYMGLETLKKGGSEAPQTPQNGHFGVILTHFGPKNPQPLVFGLKWPSKPPQKVIFMPFFKKYLGTPPGNRKNRKKGLVFGLKFSKTSEKSWKKGSFSGNPGNWGSGGPQ